YLKLNTLISLMNVTTGATGGTTGGGRGRSGGPASVLLRRLAFVALRPFGQNARAVGRGPGEVVLDHRLGHPCRIARDGAGDAGHGDLADEAGVELVGLARGGEVHQPARR